VVQETGLAGIDSIVTAYCQGVGKVVIFVLGTGCDQCWVKCHWLPYPPQVQVVAIICEGSMGSRAVAVRGLVAT